MEWRGTIAANQPAPDPLARYRQLEEIAAHEWQLPTSELAELLGLKTLSGLELERYRGMVNLSLGVTPQTRLQNRT